MKRDVTRKWGEGRMPGRRARGNGPRRKAEEYHYKMDQKELYNAR